jgi:hypothetical protein
MARTRGADAIVLSCLIAAATVWLSLNGLMGLLLDDQSSAARDLGALRSLVPIRF